MIIHKFLLCLMLMMPITLLANPPVIYHQLFFTIESGGEKDYLIAYYYGSLKGDTCVYPLPPILMMSKIKDGDSIDFGQELEELSKSGIQCFKVSLISEQHPDASWEDEFRWESHNGKLIATPKSHQMLLP
jgi:hypothetical protein